MGAKKAVKRIVLISLSIFIVVVIAVILIVRIRYGGGTADFPDRTKTPVFQFSEMEKVADLDFPPGNIDSGAFFGSYLGLLLLGATFVSVGIFTSSITDNQVRDMPEIGKVKCSVMCDKCRIYSDEF